MIDLPAFIVSVFLPFAPLFSAPTFRTALTLFSAQVLCKGRRTMADLLRTAGLENVQNFSKYHGFFSNAKWSALEAARILLTSLLKYVPGEHITIALDSTVERRKGTKIKGLGRKRDPVASTKEKKVLCIGQEWLVACLLVKFSWAANRWACPFLSLLMPPKRPLRSSKNKQDIERNGKNHKTLVKWACQFVLMIRKWIGKSLKCSLVADSAFATYELAHVCIAQFIGLISRLRIDARLFDQPDPQTGRGRRRKVGKRIKLIELANDLSQQWEQATVAWYSGCQQSIEYLTGEHLWYQYGDVPVPLRWVLIRVGTNEPVVLFSTDLGHTPVYIIEIFVSRWRIETTFEEVRRHLGYETQRHWSDKAVDRVTPSLMASFSIICLCADEICKTEEMTINRQSSAWYKKEHTTFADVLSFVREKTLRKRFFSCSSKLTSMQKNTYEALIRLLSAA